MNIVERLKELHLSDGDFVVVGSGILNALGIRESGDIDLIVSEAAYARLDADGWTHGLWGEQVVLQKDIFDLGRIWFGKDVEDLLKDAQFVDGVPYLSLEDVYAWKKIKGRDKDIRDLELIQAYWKSNERQS